MDYLEGLTYLVERADIFAGKDIHITVIANPVAGGFVIAKRVKQNQIFLAEATAKVQDKPVVTNTCTATIQFTTNSSHARTLARSVLEAALNESNPATLYLVITAGGDGTSLDVQNEIAHMYFHEHHPELADRICLIRLPFGTGNDGSDGRSLDQTLRLLTDSSVFFKQKAIRVYTKHNRENPWYAFNIASIGLDAFVTNMTNRVKNILPGDFYKIWVDLACLFYNKIYHVGELAVTAFINGEKIKEHSDRMVLYVMGVSGGRTYGSNQRILPNEHNICGVKEMSLLRKLTLKKRFKEGAHSTFPETILYTADRLVFQYTEKILVQFDGEAHLLEESDFPLTMELTEPVIPILKPRCQA